MSSAVHVHREKAHRQSAARGRKPDIWIAGRQTYVQQSKPIGRFIGAAPSVGTVFAECLFLGTSMILLFINDDKGIG